MIYFVLDGLPPSSNHAYFTKVQRKGNKSIPLRVLTAEGKRYKTGVKTYLAQSRQDVLRFFKPDLPYCLVVRFYMADLLSKTWGTPGGAANRYKKVDVSNRLKLLEDALTAACGHDDSQHFRILLWKESARTEEEERTEIWAWSWEQDDCPFDEVERHVQFECRFSPAPSRG